MYVVLGQLSLIAPPYCERRGIPFSYDPGPGVLSLQAITDPPAYHWARAAVRYDDIARALVHALKYGDRHDLAPTMGRWNGAGRTRAAGERRRACSGAAALAQALGAPVQPVGAARQNHREDSGVPIVDGLLKRVKATAQQVGLTQSERALNVQGAFAVAAGRKAEVAGRRFVLIDDVLTSGATSNVCARARLRAGAGNVDVLVFARVVDAVRAPI
jgi:predicted amidophosphoribosyltransferase